MTEVTPHAYSRRFAELYDLFHIDKSYGNEAAFIAHQLAERGVKPGAELLELACGTGSHAFALEKLGFRISAFDISEDMIARAVAKGAEAGSAVEFGVADMTQVDTGDRRYDAVLCLFDSIGYTVTNENLDAALANVHRALRPGGAFVFDFWHAPAMVTSFDPLRERRISTPHGEVVRVSETELDYLHQTATVKYSFYITNHNTVDFTELHRNRFFMTQEMCGFLEHAGFDRIELHAGFSADAPIGADTWHVLAVAQRAD